MTGRPTRLLTDAEWEGLSPESRLALNSCVQETMDLRDELQKERTRAMTAEMDCERAEMIAAGTWPGVQDEVRLRDELDAERELRLDYERRCEIAEAYRASGVDALQRMIALELRIAVMEDRADEHQRRCEIADANRDARLAVWERYRGYQVSEAEAVAHAWQLLQQEFEEEK